MSVIGARAGLASVVGGGLVLAIGVLAIGSSMTNAYGAAAGTSYAPCLTGGTPAVTHYRTVYAIGGARITGVSIGGLSAAGCANQPVIVTLKGNASGNPHAAATRTLVTFSSRLDPCTQTPLRRPIVVMAGRITLAGCASGAAQSASVHDTTLLVVRVRGHVIPTQVKGEKFTHQPGSGEVGQLPFTGSWAALTFWLGLAAITGGSMMLLAGRRRRSQRA
jgi:hypothetical protein